MDGTEYSSMLRKDTDEMQKKKNGFKITSASSCLIQSIAEACQGRRVLIGK